MHAHRLDDALLVACPAAWSRRLLVALVCVVLTAAVLLSHWWWTHRSYATGIGGRVVGLRENELVALYGPPTSRGLIPLSPRGLGVMEFTGETHAKMFGPVPDPLALSLYWRLPNDGRRYVWLGRTWHGPWLAFDGYEYRGYRF